MLLLGLKNLLLYGGLDKEAFCDLDPEIRAENRKNLTIYTGIATVLFGVLFVISIGTDTFASINVLAYCSCCLINAAIFFVLKKAPHSAVASSGLLDYVFCFVLYGFSLWIAAIHPEYPAVTAVVILPLIPLLFMKKPIHLAAITILAVVALCALSVTCKQESIATIDVWNFVSFGILSIAVATIIVRMRLFGLAQAKKNEHLSNYDMLTKLKNRNSYEQDLLTLAATARASYGCVYADANGLHELNNVYGHERGDELLRCVADTMRCAFGDSTYRVGGDEFVALVVDQDETSVRERLSKLPSRVESEGYSVSFGYAYISPQAAKDPEAIARMVEDAENEMFAQKDEHYRGRERDRRSRAMSNSAHDRLNAR